LSAWHQLDEIAASLAQFGNRLQNSVERAALPAIAPLPHCPATMAGMG